MMAVAVQGWKNLARRRDARELPISLVLDSQLSCSPQVVCSQAHHFLNFLEYLQAITSFREA